MDSHDNYFRAPARCGWDLAGWRRSETWQASAAFWSSFAATVCEWRAPACPPLEELRHRSHVPAAQQVPGPSPHDLVMLERQSWTLIHFIWPNPIYQLVDPSQSKYSQVLYTQTHNTHSMKELICTAIIQTANGRKFWVLQFLTSSIKFLQMSN